MQFYDGIFMAVCGLIFFIAALSYAHWYDQWRDETMQERELERQEAERTGVWRDVTL